MSFSVTFQDGVEGGLRPGAGQRRSHRGGALGQIAHAAAGDHHAVQRFFDDFPVQAIDHVFPSLSAGQIGPGLCTESRVSWLALVWQKVMAMAKESAVSSGLGTAGRCSRMRVISCTCFFTALP